MEYTFFVNTTSNSIRSAITGSGIPTINPVARTHLKLNVFFFATGDEAPALLDDSATFRAALIDKNDVTNVLALLTAPSAITDTGYEFEWLTLNRANLTTLIGNEASIEAVLVIAWIIAGKVERALLPVTIVNGYLQDDATSPDLSAFTTTITAAGYLRLVDANGNVFNAGLNVGEPPAL